MRDLVAYRAEFPILEHTTYLINHSLGAMPVGIDARVPQRRRTRRPMHGLQARQDRGVRFDPGTP